MTNRQIEMGAPFTVLAAYRTDLSHRQGAVALGAYDALWITLGTLFSHVSGLSHADRAQVMREANRLLRDALGEWLWARGPALDATPPRTDGDIGPRMRLLCEQIEDAGAPTLAEAMITTYVRADLDLSPLERGRLDALRARLAWKRGDHTLAEGLYQNVERAARRQRSPELRVRAYIGYAVVARLRGNLPAARRNAHRAVRLGDAHGLKRLVGLGHQTLMYAAVAGGDMNEALRQGWAAYEDMQGDTVAEAAGLTDIAQLFLDSGHVELAASGFAAALQQRGLPERVLLPALGGAAITAAHLGDLQAVTHFATAIREHVNDSGLPYQSTASRLDVADAFCHLHLYDAAEPFLRAAEAVATSHRYHELAYRAGSLRTRAPLPATPVTLTAEAISIGTSVRALLETHV
jgi:hypothetical protein